MGQYATNDVFKKEAFLEQIWREKLPSAFFPRFSGVSDLIVNGQTDYMTPTTDKTSTWLSPNGTPVIIFRDLNGGKGAKLQFPITKALNDEAKLGSKNVTLEDELERVVASQFEMTLEEWLHGVKSESPLTRQEAYFSVDLTCVQALTAWGIEHIDDLCFKAIQGVDATNVLYAGDKSDTDQLEPNHTLSIDLLRKAKLMARSGYKGNGQNRQYQKYAIDPYKMGGKEYYIVIVHPDCLYDLQKDAEYQDAMKYAADRGKDHPFFTGVDAITMDGLAIFSHPRSYITDPNGRKIEDWGANNDVPGAKVSILGQNALAIAMGKAPRIMTQTKDFGRFIQYGYQGIYNVKKVGFDNQDYGLFEVRCARTRISDLYRN